MGSFSTFRPPETGYPIPPPLLGSDAARTQRVPERQHASGRVQANTVRLAQGRYQADPLVLVPHEALLQVEIDRVEIVHRTLADAVDEGHTVTSQFDSGPQRARRRRTIHCPPAEACVNDPYSCRRSVRLVGDFRREQAVISTMLQYNSRSRYVVRGKSPKQEVQPENPVLRSLHGNCRR